METTAGVSRRTRRRGRISVRRRRLETIHHIKKETGDKKGQEISDRASRRTNQEQRRRFIRRRRRKRRISANTRL